MNSPEDRAHGWRYVGKIAPEAGDPVRVFTKGGCKVLISREPHARKVRWHLSISREDRYPGWDEIKDARAALLPVALTFAQILPPPGEYINIHRNCFHLWEIDEHEW